MPKSAIEELISLADGVLSKSDDSEVALEKIEEYTEKFSSWYNEHFASLEEGDIQEDVISLLQQLNEQHGKVLALAEDLRESITDDRRELKRKGKGIMAYIDTLPKRLSLRRTRKG